MNYDTQEYLRAFCMSRMLNFTRYFFKARTGRKFVINSHHVKICEALDRVISGQTSKLIINIAPRYSKTELAVKNFIAYGLALNPAAKFIHLSYSDDLTHDNSEEIRDIVKSDEYQSLFPYVQIKKDSDSKKKWLTTAGGGVYATATGGQVTGFGAGAVDDTSGIRKFSGAIVIDDPIKPDDALSDVRREAVNNRFESTIRNRVNSRDTPIIIIMQRLHERDLCGYLAATEPGEWETLSLPCIEEHDGAERALWPFKHTVEELHAIREANSWVFETQYMQNPMPLAGLMYEKEFKTYAEMPTTAKCVTRAYVDTADTGGDFLCCIIYNDTEIGNFVLDVYYTQDAMEITENETARRFGQFGVKEADIESNNGGRAFARNVERICRMSGNHVTAINWFHQSKNKEARIFTRSAEVQNLTYFPAGWAAMFPKFHKDITRYMKSGRNEHDDAPDALTGTIERRECSSRKGVRVR